MLAFITRRRSVSVVASLALVAGMASSVMVTSGGTASAQPDAPAITNVNGATGLALTTTTYDSPMPAPLPSVVVGGTADAGATVTVDDYGFAVTSTTAVGGTWTVDITLPDGTQDLSAVETDNGATSSSSAAVWLQVSDQVVVDGDFSAPVTSDWSYYPSFDNAWYPTPQTSCNQIEMQTEETVSVTPYAGPVYGQEAQYAELNSDCVGGIQQTLSTVPGTQYQLTFAIQARPGTQPYQNDIAVRWGETDVVGDPAVTGSGLQADEGSWQPYSYTLTATSTTTVLSFNDTDLANPDDSVGGFVDGVSVIPVVDLEPGNTNWITAENMAQADPSGSTTYTVNPSQALQYPGEDLWYQFPVNPGEQLQVSLTNAAADYNVYLFSDIYSTFDQDLTSPPTTAEQGAEDSGSAFSGSAFSGSAFSGSAFSGSAFSGSAFSGSAFSGSAFSGSAFSGSAFSGSAFSGSAFSGSAFSGSAFSTAYTSAEVSDIVGVSTQQGAVDKSVSASTFNGTGDFYVEVSGNDEAASVTPFVLTVTESGNPCVTSTGQPITLSSYSGAPTLSGPGNAADNTLIVEDSSAMDAQYGNASSVLDGPSGSLQQLVTELGNLGDKATVVDLAGSQQVQDLRQQAIANPTCPYAENLEAEAIQGIINSYRSATNSLQYVVLVGDDDIIPFFRYPDQAGLAPESGYQPPLASSSAANAALQDNLYLTDDPYGAATQLTIQGTSFPLADVAVGRLVESPGDIAATISNFIGDKGVLPKPSNGLATGYSFMAAPAQSVANAYSTGLTGTTPAQGGPYTDVDTTLIGSDWTSTQLMNDLAAGPHSLVFLGAHFSANNLLAGDDSSTLTTNTFAQEIGNNLDNSLVLSPGCHSGYNIDPADAIPGVTDTLAWPQAITEAGATLVAGTGYQYGDTNYTAYSDQLYVDLAQQLNYQPAAGAGPVPIGTALLDAKQQYLSTLFQLDGIEVKALLEATLYGLPMLGVQMPHQSTGHTGPTSVVGTPSVVTTGPGAQLGLAQTSYEYQTPSTSPLTVTDPTDNDKYTYQSFGSTQGQPQYTAVPDGPVLPVQTLDVNAAGETLTGAVLLSGTYSDSPANPLTGDPVTDTSSAVTPFSSTTFFPQTTWNPNYYNTLVNGGDTELAVAPFQYESTSTGTVQRAYSKLGFDLFYDNYSGGSSADNPALVAPPQISQVTSSYDSTTGTVSVTAQVDGDLSAGIQDVWVTYTGANSSDSLYGAWQSTAPLVQEPGTDIFTGSYTDPGVSGAPDSVFMVQAVNGVGEPSLDNNNGAYFTPGTEPGALPPATANTYTLALSGTPSSGAYGTSATIDATLTPGASTPGAPVSGYPITIALGGASAVAYANSSGVASATFALTQAPGSYPETASYAGDANDQPAASPTGTNFLITQAQPTLSLAAPLPGEITSGQPVDLMATLTAPGTTGQVPLPQQTVYFEVTPANNTSDVLGTGVGITNGSGLATSGPITLEPGDVGSGYQVTAYFGATSVTVPGGATEDAATVDYLPATSGSAPVTLADSTQSGLVAAPDPANFGQSVTLTDTVSSGDVLGTGAPNEGTVTFYDGTGELGKASVSRGSASLTVNGLQGGSHTFTAKYSDTSSNYATSTATATDNVVFTETISGTHSGALTIGKGQLVLVTGKVTGAVSVSSGGGLEVEGGTIGGALASSGAVQFTLCGAQVGGAMSVTRSTGFVFIGGPTGNGANCSRSTIGGAVSLSGNKGGLEMTGSSVGGAMSVTSNSGSGPIEPNGAPVEPELSGNTMGGALACSGNTPGLTDGGSANKAAVKAGQCAGSF